jgi:hypothetical protein
MRFLAALFVASVLAVPAAAQQPPAPTPAPEETQEKIDVERLPLNLSRIQRELKHAVDLESREGLNLRYVIQIYGSAPPLDLFSEDENLETGPVPYGAPTHRELIQHVTPQPFRAPAADFSNLIRWLKERNKEKDKE